MAKLYVVSNLKTTFPPCQYFDCIPVLVYGFILAANTRVRAFVLYLTTMHLPNKKQIILS